jgi:porin
VARGAILSSLAGISLATLGFSGPVLAADIPLKADPWVAPIYPVPLRPFSRVLTDDTPSPYQLKLQYTGEAWRNEGGIQTGGTYMSNYLAILKINTEKAFGWTGGRFYASTFYNDGESLNANYTGAIQQPSRPIDVYAPRLLRLYEAYYNQTIGNTDVRVGVMDLQTMFGATKPMDVFFNGAFAWTQTLDVSGRSGLNGPSTYPNTSLGARVRHTINDQWSVQVAVVNGLADGTPPGPPLIPPQTNDIKFSNRTGALAIGQVDYTPFARTKIIVGYWGFTGLLALNSANPFLPPGMRPESRGSNGGYIGGATRLFTIKDSRGLDGFINFGIADSNINVIDRSFNAGLTWTGLFDARPTDKLGVGVGVIHAPPSFRGLLKSAGLAGAEYEVAYELTYRATLSDWLTVQPNIQYIVHPSIVPVGPDGKAKNSFVFGLHFEMGRLFNL